MQGVIIQSYIQGGGVKKCNNKMLDIGVGC